MAAAATRLPADMKRTLRPMRSPRPAWPTMRRLMAGIAGPSTQLAAACRTRDAMTIAKIGHAASASALRPIPTTANPAAVRGERTEIDDGASRHLAGQRDEAADRQDEADLALRPSVGRQIDGDERPEAGLQIGDEECEPVEPATAAGAHLGFIGRLIGAGAAIHPVMRRQRDGQPEPPRARRGVSGAPCRAMRHASRLASPRPTEAPPRLLSRAGPRPICSYRSAPNPCVNKTPSRTSSPRFGFADDNMPLREPRARPVPTERDMHKARP